MKVLFFELDNYLTIHNKWPENNSIGKQEHSFYACYEFYNLMSCQSVISFLNIWGVFIYSYLFIYFGVGVELDYEDIPSMLTHFYF